MKYIIYYIDVNNKPWFFTDKYEAFSGTRVFWDRKLKYAHRYDLKDVKTKAKQISSCFCCSEDS